MKNAYCLIACCMAGLTAFGEIAVPLAKFGFGPDSATRPGYPRDKASFVLSAERTPEGEACGAFTLLREPGKVPHDVQLRFDAPMSLATGAVYRLRFFAKADRDVQVPVAVAQTREPWRNFGGESPWLGPEWREVEVRFEAQEDVAKQVMSLPFIMPGLLPKGTTLTVGPISFDRMEPARVEAGKEWRPLDMGEHRCVYFKSERIPELEIVPGTALDLSQFLPRHDIDANGRLVADRQGRLVFANALDRPVRLRGFNCTYGGAFDRFQEASKAELEQIAEQIRLAGLDFIRFHCFDGKFAGKSGMKFYQYRNTDLADVPLPQTEAELAATVDRDFLDRFHWFVKCLRDRGVYVMFDIFTSASLMAKAGKAKGYPRYQLFVEEKYRNHWKAAYAFWMNTVNPYTKTRFLDDPQVLGITFYNEQEHLFGEKTDKLKDFTPAFRAACGTDMPEFSLALLRKAGPAADKARAFLRARIAEMNAFYLGVVRASGFKGFVTNWDMFMRNLEGDARKELNAVAMHPYHAHPNLHPVPAGVEQKMALNPWNRGKCETVTRASSIAINAYMARASVTRVLGKPFFLTEFSHCGGNRYAQEAPVVQSAAAALQDWQVLAPHANLVMLWHYGGAHPFDFDSGASLMARVASLATAFGWQRGDVKSAPHAVSFHVPESTVASKAYTGAIGSAYNSLHLLTRVGSDYRNAHNPLADLDVVPESYVGATSKGMWATLTEEVRENDALRVAQVAKLREAGILPPGNRTDAVRGLFESETGEIVTDMRRATMTIDAPRFQAAALKPGSTARLSQLDVRCVTTPVSILAISLDATRPVRSSPRVLLAVATRFMAEGSLWGPGPGMWSERFLDEGGYRQLIRAGRFRFSLASEAKTPPKVYALRMNGTRAEEIRATLADGRLAFDLDTSTLAFGTPFFEIVCE